MTPLAALVSLRVLSDAKGADVEARFETADDAARAAKALEACSVPFQDGAATCAHTRRDVAALAVMDRPQKDFAERCFVVLGWKPVCPAGGTYVVHPVTREVSCTAHGTDAKPTPSPRAPSRVLRDLRVGTSADAAADAAPNDTRVVRFRVPIDWNR